MYLSCLFIINIAICLSGFMGCLAILSKKSINTKAACRTLPLSMFGLGWAALLFGSLESIIKPDLITVAVRLLFLIGIVILVICNLTDTPEKQKE